MPPSAPLDPLLALFVSAERCSRINIYPTSHLCVVLHVLLLFWRDSPALPGAHPVHDFGVDDHEADVEWVEQQQDDGLVVLEVTVPREPDETADRQRVEERVSDQGSPVQVQHLQHNVVEMHWQVVQGNVFTPVCHSVWGSVY